MMKLQSIILSERSQAGKFSSYCMILLKEVSRKCKLSCSIGRQINGFLGMRVHQGTDYRGPLMKKLFGVMEMLVNLIVVMISHTNFILIMAVYSTSTICQ